MNILTYVKKNWDSLPKSTFDELEVVIVKEISNYDGGWGHHSYEGYGIDKDGKMRWVFSSGCSCEGGPREEDIKSFIVDNDDLRKLDAELIDFDSLQVDFESYG